MSQASGLASSPTRTRTRNTSLEARDDFRFTIGLSAEGGGIEPYPTPFPGRLVSTQRPEPVRLPSNSVDSPGIEPGLPPCHSGVFSLDHEPVQLVQLQWTAEELNPDLLVAGQVSCRWTSSPFIAEVRPGVEPDLRPYHGRVPPKTLTDQSHRGRNRTAGTDAQRWSLLVVTQTSWPLDYAMDQ